MFIFCMTFEFIMRIDTFWTHGAIGWIFITCNDTRVFNVPRIGCFYYAFFSSWFCSEKNVSIFVSCPICKMQYAFLWYFAVNLTKHFSKKAIVDKLKKTGSEIVKQTKQAASSTALAGLYLPEVCHNITSSSSFDSMHGHFGKKKTWKYIKLWRTEVRPDVWEQSTTTLYSDREIFRVSKIYTRCPQLVKPRCRYYIFFTRGWVFLSL